MIKNIKISGTDFLKTLHVKFYYAKLLRTEEIGFYQWNIHVDFFI